MDLLRKLYTSQEAINSLLQRVENGEFTTSEVADTIEALNGTIEQNCDDIATVMLSQEAEMQYIKAEIDRLHGRLEDMRTNYEKLKGGLQSYLKGKGVKKVHTPTHDFSMCKNGGKQSIEITADIYDIPEQYRVLVPKPNNELIRLALESGQELEFAHFKERGEHIKIK